MAARAHRLIAAICAGLLLGGAWLLATPAAAQELARLLDKPDAYDGHQVTVTGAASAPRHNESRGKSFTIFDLTDDQGRSVRVFSWSDLSFSGGDTVIVEGTFLKEKQVGQHTIKNEIEARSVRVLSEHH